jgi:ribosomal RNA-processing protein 12
VQDALLQLVCALVPYQDETRLDQVTNLCACLLLKSDHSEQKRAYRAIEQMCLSDQEQCKLFLQNNIERLVQLMVDADEVCKNPSRAVSFCIS